MQVTNIILICLWLLRSNFESSQYSRYLALGNSRVTAAAGLRLYTHPVQITLLTTSPLHSHCANRFIEVGIPLEVNWIIGISAQNDCHSQLSLQFSNWKLVSSLLFSWHWRHVQDVFITLLPPSHHCRQWCLSHHFAHHHLFISHYFRCDEFSPPRHVSGGRGLVAGRVTDNGLHQFYWTETRYYVTSQEYLHNNIGIFPVSEAVRTNVPCHTSAKIKLSTSVQLFLARKILWMKAK